MIYLSLIRCKLLWVKDEKNDGYKDFVLFPQCFQKFSFIRVVKTRDYVVEGERHFLFPFQTRLFAKMTTPTGVIVL